MVLGAYVTIALGPSIKNSSLLLSSAAFVVKYRQIQTSSTLNSFSRLLEHISLNTDLVAVPLTFARIKQTTLFSISPK